MPIEELFKEYDLQEVDILAALAYATRVIVGEELQQPILKAKFLLDVGELRSNAEIVIG